MSAQTVEQCPPTVLELAQQQDRVTRWYLDLMIDGLKPANRPNNVGRWLPLVEMAEQAYESSSNGNRGKIVTELLNSCIRTEKFPGLEAMLTGTEAVPSAGESPQPAEVEPEQENMPTLPESARVPDTLSHPWLEKYFEYSKLVSPRGFDDFHTAGGLEVLSTAVAGRIEIPGGPDGQHTSLMIAFVAEPGKWAKSTTAQVYVKVLRAAGLGFLLGADETTPQKFMSDCVGYIPSNYFQLSEEKQQRWRQRLAMPGQRGWYYDELGAFFRAMNKLNGPMEAFRGLVLKLDTRALSYTYATQARDHEEIERPYLALLGCTTFADFRQVAKAGSAEWNDGMLSRFIPIVPPPGSAPDKPLLFESFPVPYELTSALREMHEWLGIPEIDIVEEEDEKDKKGRTRKLVIKVLRTRTERVITPDREVKAAFNRYESALNHMEKPEDLASSYVRLPIKALRVAALFAGLDRTQTITMRYWSLAQEIAERWRVSLHRLYDQTNNSHTPTQTRKLEDEILRVVRLLEAKGKPPTLKEIRDNGFLGTVEIGKLRMAITDLVRGTGQLAEDKVSRKSPCYSSVEETDR